MLIQEVGLEWQSYPLFTIITLLALGAHLWSVVHNDRKSRHSKCYRTEEEARPMPRKTFIINIDEREKDVVRAVGEMVRTFPAWARITDHTWAVITSKDVEHMASKLEAILADDERYFIVESAGDAAWKSVRCRDDWLYKNL